MVNYPASLDTNNTLYLLVNQAKTYLSGNLGNTGGNNNQASSIDVEDGSELPSTGGFILVGQELIQYTTRSSNKLTGITRAYGGTTAVPHRSGSIVKMPVMAEFHNANKDAIIAIETKIGIAGAETFPKSWSQATDPSLDSANGVKNTDIWDNTGNGQVYIRSGGIWKAFAGS